MTTGEMSLRGVKGKEDIKGILLRSGVPAASANHIPTFVIVHRRIAHTKYHAPESFQICIVIYTKASEGIIIKVSWPPNLSSVERISLVWL